MDAEADEAPMEDDSELVKEDDLFPGCSNMDEFLQAGYPIIMEGIKSSNSLPQDKQFSYLKTFPEFSDVMKAEGKHLQEIMQKILTYCGVKKQIADQVPTDKFDVVTDLNDKLLDRIVKNLGAMDGTRFNPHEDFGESSKKVSGSWNKNYLAAAAAAKEREDEEIVQLVVQTRTIRPQVLFKDKIDNRNTPWVPKIKEKPNQLKPLALVMGVNENGEEYYRHPYEYELSLWKPREEWLVNFTDVKMPPPVEETDFVYVESEDQVPAVLEDLKRQKMLSVDLEAHTYRSYMGFVCLMQISTESKDYLIDTLKLRHVLYTFNDVFTNPKILKIFHGATNDIEWLQRDFGLYVVGMFDTYSAAKVLEYPKLSLAYLLKKFCNIDANKKFQLFDWRIRPLPPKAIQYAREDTHYLSYIYKMMSNELIEKGLTKTNLLEAAFNSSCLTCQRVFMKPRWNEDSHMFVYHRMKRHLDNRQLYALKEMFKWRDTVAREEDESTGYVFPNHMMMQVCQTLPRELQGILACCNPIPPLVRQHALAIHNIILRAKEQPLVKSVTDVENVTSKSSQFSASRDVDLEIRLNTYVHDSTNQELRDDLPTLLDGTLPDLGEPPVVEPKLSLFVKTPNPSNYDVQGLIEAVVKINFIPPYERYKKVLPYSIQEEKERLEKERKAEENRMQQSTEKQYSTKQNAPTSSTSTFSAGASSPNKHKMNRTPKPLADRLGAKKKVRTVETNVAESEDEDDVLPIVKSEKKIKREIEEEEEDPASRVGVCGGSISAHANSNQGQHDNTPRNKRERRLQRRGGKKRGRGMSGDPPGSGEVGTTGRSSLSAHNTNQDGGMKTPRSSHHTPEGGFEPFDYSSVNFREFQSRTPRNIQLHSGDKKDGKKKNRQFRGRNSNKRQRGGSGGARGGKNFTPW